MSGYARRGVHGQTVETIAHRVLSGRIPEGATIDLGALQAELDVSLTALRESLKVLAAKGMVDARQKRGTFVRPRADWHLLDADVLRWRFESAEGPGTAAGNPLLRDLGEVRAIVEPAAARLAAERRTEADLAALEAALEAMAASAADGGRDKDGSANGNGSEGAAHAIAADLAFHRALLGAAHNELLERMEMVIATGLAFRDHLVHTSGHSKDPVPSHRAVLDAVRAQDPDKAEAAMRTLLDQAGRDLNRVQAGGLP
ncbi:FadR/GntR family transcriptional regulator [Streptomyces pathocidini]|uniref:FadR/GntR family transcriptional regulator n=1 Tax=Streptomyces pathocidini TaxID=1650571 RepID=A0ABW7UKK8_9ACTN|nr:FCD domain-containing protein [Streptomyces pathocidini]